MTVFNLPRGRFTDALVAVIVAVSVIQLAPAVSQAAFAYGFSPALFIQGGWRDPLMWLSPVVSQFLLTSVAGALFTTVFLLIAGRYAERALGGLGMLGVFVIGAYGGAIARTVLTPGSAAVTAGAEAGLFAIIGAYLMLYGIPSTIPINRTYSRPLQIAALAAIWSAVQLTFIVSSGVFEFSVGLIDPLGGLLAGVLIGRPLLAWRYRRA